MNDQDDQQEMYRFYGLYARLAILRYQSLKALAEQPEEEQLDADLLQKVTRAEVASHALNSVLQQIRNDDGDV